MISLNKRESGAGPGLLVAFLILAFVAAFSGCDSASGEGDTFITIRKDTAWNKFEVVEILWKETATGTEASLYKGHPGNLSAKNRFRVDGFHGQPIQILIRGFIANTLAFEEKRSFDSRNPTVVSKEFTPIVPVKPSTEEKPPIVPINPGVEQKPPILTAIQGGKPISIRDSLSFTADASMESGLLSGYAWDCDGDGIFEDSGSIATPSARLKSGRRYPDSGSFTVTLKVMSQGDSIAFVKLQVVVSRDAPKAHAGEDITIFPGASAQLKGIASDGFGTVARTEWRIGNGAFQSRSPDTAFTAPATPGTTIAIFRVVDDDSLSTEDTVFVHVVSRMESFLSNMTVTYGELVPKFSSAITAYTDSVGPDDASITVIPTGEGTIKVDGVASISGQHSQRIDLKPGPNTIKVTVQKAGAEEVTYTLTVVRSTASNNAYLTSLSIPDGSLVPAFTDAETTYTAKVIFGSSKTTVMATASNAFAIIKVQGLVTQSGMASPSIDLPVGETMVAIVVTAQSGAIRTYRIKVERAAAAIPNLIYLSVNEGFLKPTFNSEVETYSVTTDGDDTAVAIRAAPLESTAAIMIGGRNVPVTDTQLSVGPRNKLSAVLSVPIPLGETIIPIVVTADGGAKRTYTVAVTRPKSSNNYLASVSLPKLVYKGTAFERYYEEYSLTAGDTLTSMVGTATLENAAASMTVNGKPTASGSPFTLDVPLGYSQAVIEVTAQDGSKRTYRFNIQRTGSTDATLSGLKVKEGSLVPAFNPGTISYSATTPSSTSAATITATTNNSAATLKISGITAVSGQPLEIFYGSPGAQINIEVTAQSGATKSYVLVILH